MTSSSMVDGLRLPKQTAGHPALELVNTRTGWGERHVAEHDYLASLDHLIALARVNDLLDHVRADRLRRRAARERPQADDEVVRARQLRGDLHDTLVGTASHAATTRLGKAVADARSRQQLVVGNRTARWVFPGGPSLSDPLDLFLVSAGELLVSGPRVGACPGHGCGWLFVNRSGRRRWCQMAVCGNRAKQAAHAARLRP